jgi:hypothetical protein
MGERRATPVHTVPIRPTPPGALCMSTLKQSIYPRKNVIPVRVVSCEKKLYLLKYLNSDIKNVYVTLQEPPLSLLLLPCDLQSQVSQH